MREVKYKQLGRRRAALREVAVAARCALSAKLVAVGAVACLPQSVAVRAVRWWQSTKAPAEYATNGDLE
jgi:hypothetical protein